MHALLSRGRRAAATSACRFAEDLAGMLHWNLTHQVHGEGLELLGEVLSAAAPRWIHTVRLAVIATASPWQGTQDEALFVYPCGEPHGSNADVRVR